MSIKPEQAHPSQDARTAAAEEIRLRWLGVIKGLVQEAARGNMRAFLILRDETWGVQRSGPANTISEISLEELLSEDECGFQSPGAKEKNQ